MKWWGGLILLTIIFWFTSFFYGFAQDDFIHLDASRAQSITEFLNFFNPFYQFADIFFFRPLPTQVHFFFMTKLFGLNAFGFHIVSLIFHITNGILFYLIVNKVWKSRKLSLLSAAFYLISSIHFLSLFYISSFQQIARTFYILSAVYLFFLAIRHPGESDVTSDDSRIKSLFYVGSLVAYIAALLSKETSLILPLLLPLIEILRRRGDKWIKVLKENILPLIPFVGVTITYIIIRVVGFQTIFTKGEYSYSFSLINILQNLKWYLIWSFGLPEILSTYPSLKPESFLQFGRDFTQGNLIILLFLVLILTIIILIFSLRKTMHVRSFTQWKILVISGIIFLISITPVLILTQHKYPQYLDLAFLGFLPILGWVLIKGFERRKIVALAGIVSFVALQYFSINLSEQTHWTTKRSKVADYYHQKFLKEYPNIEESTKIILVGSAQQTKEVSYALAGKYAFQVWYPGKIREVQYLGEKDLPTNRSSLIIKHLDFY